VAAIGLGALAVLDIVGIAVVGSVTAAVAAWFIANLDNKRADASSGSDGRS
jgi:hypothetical protein